MKIPRFFIDGTIALEQPFELPQETSHYIANVLRLSCDDPIVLFNGDNNEYAGTLLNIGKRSVVVEATSKLGLSVESTFSLHLGQGVAKGDRMDFVLQKACELGVTAITPLITERCNVKLSAERWQKKAEQWRKILISACEQSGRNTLPTLHPVTPLSDWLSQTTEQTRLTLHPRAENAFNTIQMSQHGARLLIGPEGGLSDNELYLSSERGFSTVSLGPRVLRTETAALASIAILQAQYGDLV